MSTPPSPPPTAGASAKERFWKRLAIWLSILIAALGVAGTFWQAQIAEGARRDAQEAEKHRQDAESRADQLEKQLSAQRLKELDAVCALGSQYGTLLNDLHIAISKYKEVPNDDNKDAVLEAARAFVNFVRKWREAQPVLAKILDGEVNKLSDAAGQGDLNNVISGGETLERGANANLPILCEILKRAQSSPRRQPKKGT